MRMLRSLTGTALVSMVVLVPMLWASSLTAQGDSIPGVTLGFPTDRPIPRVPPAEGPIDHLEDPVHFGNTDLVGFGPLGTASSGTIYVSDQLHRLYAIVLFGKTARITVWFYNTKSGRWTT